MKSKLIAAICLTLVLGGTGVGAYLGVTATQNSSNEPSTQTQTQTKPTFGTNSLNDKENVEYKKDINLHQLQSISTKSDRFNINTKKADGSPAILEKPSYYFSELERLINDRTKDPDDILIVPKKYFDVTPGTNRLRALGYNGSNIGDSGYSFGNTLNSVLTKNSNNRELATYFTKYLRESQTAKQIFGNDAPSLAYTSNYSNKKVDKCLGFDLGKLQGNNLRKMVSSIYSRLSCDDGYGIGTFDFKNFLSYVLNIDPKEYRLDDPTLTKEDAEWLVSYLGDDYGKENVVTVPTNIVKWIETLSLGTADEGKEYAGTSKIDRLPSVSGILERIGLEDLVGSTETPDPLKILKSVSEKTKKYLDSRSFNTLSFTLLGLLESFQTLFNRNPDLILSEDLKKTDFITSLVSSSSQSVNNIVADLLSLDNSFLTDVISYAKDSATTSIEKKIKDNSGYEEYKKNVLDKEQENLTSIDASIYKLNNDIARSQRGSRNYKAYVSTKYEKTLLEENLVERQKDYDYSNEDFFARSKQLAAINEQLSEQNDRRITAVNEALEIIEKRISELTSQQETLSRQVAEARSRRTLSEERIAETKKDIENAELNIQGYANQLEVKRIFEYQDQLKTKQEERKASVKALAEKNQSYSSQSLAFEKNTKYIEVLKGLIAAPDKKAYLKSQSMFDNIAVFQELITKYALNTLDELGMINKTTGAVEFAFKSIADLDKLKPLFFKKDAVARINKMIQYVNKVVDEFSDNTLDSILKFVFLAIPKDVLDALNTKINILHWSFKLSEGLKITPDFTYGLLAGIAGTAGGAALGTGIGTVIGGIVGGKGGAVAGAAIGAGVGAATGTAIGAGVAYNYFNDGYLTIDKLNSRIIDRIVNLNKRKTELGLKNSELIEKYGKEFSFNVFEDGHKLIKEVYFKQLNEVTGSLGRVFMQGQKIESTIDAYQEIWKDKEVTPYTVIGEITKSFLASPKVWKYIAESKSFVTTKNNSQLYSLEISRKIKEALNYSKENLEFLAKSKDVTYIKALMEVQDKYLNWLVDSAILTTESSFLDEDDKRELRIGYNPSEISLETLKKLEKGFIDIVDEDIKITFVDYSRSSKNNLDMYLEYKKIDAKQLSYSRFTSKSVQEDRIFDKRDEEIVVPVLVNRYVIATQIDNTHYATSNYKIDSAELERLYKI